MHIVGPVFESWSEIFNVTSPAQPKITKILKNYLFSIIFHSWVETCRMTKNNNVGQLILTDPPPTLTNDITPFSGQNKIFQKKEI